MSNTNRKWEKLSPEAKSRCINEFIDFYLAERDEEIGMVAAEEILNFFLQTAGKEIYNKGVSDAVGTMEQRFEDVKMDVEMLMD